MVHELKVLLGSKPSVPDHIAEGHAVVFDKGKKLVAQHLILAAGAAFLYLPAFGVHVFLRLAHDPKSNRKLYAQGALVKEIQDVDPFGMPCSWLFRVVPVPGERFILRSVRLFLDRVIYLDDCVRVLHFTHQGLYATPIVLCREGFLP